MFGNGALEQAIFSLAEPRNECQGEEQLFSFQILRSSPGSLILPGRPGPLERHRTVGNQASGRGEALADSCTSPRG
jgi:hypothetical protein